MDLSSEGHEAKVPVIKRPEYTVSLEQINPSTAFVHMDVRRWSLSTRQHLIADFECLCDLHGGPLYAAAPPDDPKLQRFCRLMGGELAAYHTDLSTGRTLLIFKR